MITARADGGTLFEVDTASAWAQPADRAFRDHDLCAELLGLCLRLAGQVQPEIPVGKPR